MVLSNGKLYVLSSPSGGGKSTVIRELRRRNPDIGYSVSVTTRPRRKDERHGEDYFFVDESEFKKKIQEGAFIEWAVVHGYYYGTLWEQVETQMRNGKKILFDIDVHGGIQIKRKKKDAVLIFILPPSVKELERRLRNRQTESNTEIDKRLKNAQHEMEFTQQYDFQVINDSFEKTIEDIEAIIRQT
jgi:guanylate kinase